jgi:ribulose-phosphate 3-epimerase
MASIISASVMCADLGNLREEIRRLDRAGVDRFHWDIMDGVFVPNYTFGPDPIRAVRDCTRKEFVLHLMVTAPDRYADLWAGSGCELILLHLEATPFFHRTVRGLQSRGVRVGCAINPLTAVEPLRYLAPYLSQVLVMTVDPGFAGQKFIPEMVDKVAEVRKLVGPDVEIAVDGNIGETNIPALLEAGASVFVAGTSSVFLDRDYEANVAKMRRWLKKGV